MIVSGSKILELLYEDDNTQDLHERLVISPLLDLNEQLRPGSGSIDLRLGQQFVTPKRTRLSSLDYLSDDYERDTIRYKDESFVPIGDYFVLHPKQFVLGETLEWIHLPSDLAGYVVGRSSRGRDGLIIATAVGIHPRYCGIITLEITNVGEIPLYLHPGSAICQLFLHTVESPKSGGYDESEFVLSTGPANASTSRADKDLIDRLINEKKY